MAANDRRTAITESRLSDVAAYVLAGGASSRFGHDKALVKIGRGTMLEHMTFLLASITERVKIVGAREKYAGCGVDVVADRWPGEGPLGGIITALHHTEEHARQCEWNLIVSCDMPFLFRGWLNHMVERALASAAEVIVPRSAQGLEPLCVCWRTSAVTALQEAFDHGVRKIIDGMKLLPLEVLDQADWKRFDNAGRLFWNMNTQRDYEEAVRIWESENS